MKTLLTALALAAAAFTLTGQPSVCTATWCPSYTCFAKCSQTCSCLSKDVTGGVCISIQAVPGLLEQGWVVLE